MKQALISLVSILAFGASAYADDTFDPKSDRCTNVVRVLNIMATGEVDLGVAIDADAVVSVTTIVCLKTEGGDLQQHPLLGPVLVFDRPGTTTNTIGNPTTSIGGSTNLQVGAGGDFLIGGASGTVGGGKGTDTDTRGGGLLEEPIDDFKAVCVFAPGTYPIDYCSGGDFPYGENPEDQAHDAMDERNMRALILSVLIKNNDPLIQDVINDVDGAEERLREKLKDGKTMISVISEEIVEQIPGVKIKPNRGRTSGGYGGSERLPWGASDQRGRRSASDPFPPGPKF